MSVNLGKAGHSAWNTLGETLASEAPVDSSGHLDWESVSVILKTMGRANLTIGEVQCTDCNRISKR